MSKRWNAGIFLAKAKELSRRLRSWHIEDFLNPVQFASHRESRSWVRLTFREIITKVTADPSPRPVGWQFYMHEGGEPDEEGCVGEAFKNPDQDTDRSLTMWLIGDFLRHLDAASPLPALHYLKESYNHLLDLPAWTISEPPDVGKGSMASYGRDERGEPRGYMVTGRPVPPEFLDTFTDAAEKLLSTAPSDWAQTKPNLGAATQYALRCVTATNDLYRFVSMWRAGHDWGKASHVVHSFLVGHHLLFQDGTIEQINLCRRKFTQARQARGPIQDFAGHLALNAHEAAVNTLLALYSIVCGAAAITDQESDTRLGYAAMDVTPLITPFRPKDVPWLHAQFETRRDAICGSVFQSFPKLETQSLAIELEWEAANVPAGKAGLADEEKHALAMLDEDPAQPQGPLEMSRTKNDELKALSLHAQMCVHYGLILARVIAGPRPGNPDACQGIIPLVKELNECLDETTKRLSQHSSRLTSVRTGIFKYGTLAAPNACTAAFWLAHDAVGYVLPALTLVSDGERAAAHWFFENWDNLAQSFRDHRDNFRFAVQDHKDFERFVATEIVWETEKVAQGAGGKTSQSLSSDERKLPNLERLIESTKALTDLPGTLEALLAANLAVKESRQKYLAPTSQELAHEEYHALLTEWKDGLSKLGDWKRDRKKEDEFIKQGRRFVRAHQALLLKYNVTSTDFPEPPEIANEERFDPIMMVDVGEELSGSGPTETHTPPPTEVVLPDQYVTLDQIAAIVNRSKRTLEKYKTRKNDPLPNPDIGGGGGKPDEWKWSSIQPWLRKEFGPKVPDRFPSIRSHKS